MGQKRRPGSYSLQTQLVIGFALLAVLTAAMVGIPAVLLLDRELEQQAWAKAGAGGSAAVIMIEALGREVEQFAILTAQRPTLEALVRSGGGGQLDSYIQTLQAGYGISNVVICENAGGTISSAGEEPISDLCAQNPPAGMYLVSSGGQRAAFLIHARPFPAEQAALGRVWIGQRIDDDTLRRLTMQGSVTYFLRHNGQVLAASWPGQVEIDGAEDGQSNRVRIDFDAAPYFGVRIPIGPPGLEIISALPVSDLYQTQANFRAYLLIGMLVAAAAGSLLGFFAAREIGRPLRRIGAAAVDLRMGGLDIPIPLDIPVREVYTVARTLEESRTALQHTLNEYHLQQARLEHVMGSIVEGIMTLNHLGRVTFFSQGAERITGLRQEDVIGQRCDDILHPVEASALFSDFIPAPGQRRNVALRLAGGRTAALSISGAKLNRPNTSQEVVALVLRDVSDEESIRRLLGDFIANITHEFRTPLSALAASIELLHDQYPDLRPEEIDELLGSIQLGVIGLQTLIDNLLEGASIETGQFQVIPRPVSMNEIIHETAALLHPLLVKYHQKLEIELPEENLTVQADARRTVQVMVNLLSNAIKNNPENGVIRIDAARENGFACILVSDQGPGIPEGQLVGIFTRFVRAEPEGARAQAGAGLGLSVVKHIVEAQGGQAAARNGPEGGAVFSITIPIVETKP